MFINICLFLCRVPVLPLCIRRECERLANLFSLIAEAKRDGDSEAVEYYRSFIWKEVA